MLYYSHELYEVRKIFEKLKKNTLSIARKTYDYNLHDDLHDFYYYTNWEKQKFAVWFDGDKKDVIWFDQSASRKYCYIQLGEKQYNYEEIKKNEHKFMLELNNELTKIALETLE